MTEQLEGRELDAEIAERCFEWKWISYPAPNAPDGRMLTLLAPPEPAVLPNAIREIAIPSDANAPRFSGWDKMTYWRNLETMQDLYAERPRGFPHYSTDMAAAWQVVEWAREQVHEYAAIFWDGFWGQWACTLGVLTAYADTAPEAICRAALELARREGE